MPPLIRGLDPSSRYYVCPHCQSPWFVSRRRFHARMDKDLDFGEQGPGAAQITPLPHESTITEYFCAQCDAPLARKGMEPSEVDHVPPTSAMRVRQELMAEIEALRQQLQQLSEDRCRCQTEEVNP